MNMKLPPEIIEKAVEGGFDGHRVANLYKYKGKWKVAHGGNGVTAYWETVILDPLFWSALGKAKGWERYGSKILSVEEDPSPYWKNRAKRLFDLILSSASEEEIKKYWEELIV